MWKRLSKREKRLAVITAAVLVCALGYRVIFLGRLKSIWALETKATELEIAIMEMGRALALGDRIETQYRDYEAIISQEGTDLEESKVFLRTLSDITKANEMKVIRQEQPPILPSRYYKIFSARLGVNTRPIWLARFLVSLEKSKELIRVEDILIKALDENENLSVNMKLTKVVAAGGREGL